VYLALGATDLRKGFDGLALWLGERCARAGSLERSLGALL